MTNQPINPVGWALAHAVPSRLSVFVRANTKKKHSSLTTTPTDCFSSSATPLAEIAHRGSDLCALYVLCGKYLHGETPDQQNHNPANPVILSKY